MDAETQHIQDLEARVEELESQLRRYREELENARAATPREEKEKEKGNNSVEDGEGVSDAYSGDKDEKATERERVKERLEETWRNVYAKGNEDGHAHAHEVGNGYGYGYGDSQSGTSTWKWPMKREEYRRYGRQLIMPEVGIRGMPFVLVFLYGSWSSGRCCAIT